MNALIVGRVICGVGGSGSGLYCGVFTIIAATMTMAERPIYVSGTGISWGLGTVLGPIVGGAFQESAVGWRWAFYINLFIGAACAPAYLFLPPSKDPRPGVPYMTRVKELDYAGMVLLMGCLVSLIMAINFGGLTYAWNSGQIIGLFVTAVVLFVLLAIRQSWTILITSPRRLIPVQFMRSSLIIILFVCTSASAAGVLVPIFSVPLFFQFTRGDGALDAGVRLLPLIIVLVVTITINGTLMAKFGYYMPWYLVGGLVCVAGGALMYTVNQDTSPSGVYGYTVLLPISTSWPRLNESYTRMEVLWKNGDGEAVVMKQSTCISPQIAPEGFNHRQSSRTRTSDSCISQNSSLKVVASNSVTELAVFDSKVSNRD